MFFVNFHVVAVAVQLESDYQPGSTNTVQV